MLFKDENGAEWEEVQGQGFEDGRLTVRPVKAEPKWEVKLETDRMIPPEYWINISFLDIKEDQAQLIKEAIEALMEYLTNGRAYYDVMEQQIIFARQSLKEENNA